MARITFAYATIKSVSTKVVDTALVTTVTLVVDNIKPPDLSILGDLQGDNVAVVLSDGE